MEADYGISLQEGSMLTVENNNAYNFGTGDFAITVLFQTLRPGTLLSRKSTEGGQSCGGWLLVLNPEGVIKMATDNGVGFYEVNSKPTAALDGTWHSVAAVRCKGDISIFFDGTQISVTPRSSLPTPLDISNQRRIVIGNCDQEQEPHRQFLGVLEDVTIWNRALNADEIKRTIFNRVTPDDNGLVGFWEMNKNLDDTSFIRNRACAAGPVSWVPVFHCVWAEAENNYSYCAIDLHEELIPDYGIKLTSDNFVEIHFSKADMFDNGEFTFTAIFQAVKPGFLVDYVNGNGDGVVPHWAVVLSAHGEFVFLAKCPSPCQAISISTTALDGNCHSVVLVYSKGKFTIFFDGILILKDAVPGLSSQKNVSNANGQTDQIDIGKNFVGIIEDVTLWNCALDDAGIQRTRLNQVTASDPGLVGFWQMDQNLEDASPMKNHGQTSGSVHSVQFVEVSHQAKRQQSLKIEKGTAYLYGAVIDKSKPGASFPENALIKVFRPDGSKLDQVSNTEDLYVHMNGDSVWAFVVKNPQAGYWRFDVECPTSMPLLLSVQTVPTQDIASTIGNTLQGIYGEVPASHARLLSDKAGAHALASFSLSWSKAKKWAGLTLAVVGHVAVVAVAVVGAVAAAPVAPIVLGLGVGLGLALVGVDLFMNSDVGGASLQVADAMGLGMPEFGGTAKGSFSLIIDGEAYFSLLRDLLLAAQAGHYDASGITVPEKPTFENLIKGISSKGKKAYVLLWDSSELEHAWKNNKLLSLDWPKTLVRDASCNARTAKALKDLPNVIVRQQSYFINSCYSQTVRSLKLPLPLLNSYHQKIAVVSINKQKCALVGGLNLVTPDYRDKPEHPMNDKTNFYAWHDGAVFLQGPIVDIIEKEFDRRWDRDSIAPEMTEKKELKRRGDQASPDAYVKLAYWEVNHGSCLDDEETCKGGKSRIPYKNPLTNEPYFPIDVLVTNAEYSKKVTQIKDKLLEQIKAVNSYMYFENFTFYDTILIKAIIDKVVSASKDFRCIILIPHPTKDNDAVEQRGQFFMCRMAFAAILLSVGEWQQVNFKYGDIVTRQECTLYTVIIPDNKSIEYAIFRYKRESDGAERSFPIMDVTGIEMTQERRIILASPVRYFESLNPNEEKYQLPGLSPNFRSIYIHSKIALFDDSYALIGSANFNPRSMEWDGECSVGVSDRVKAKEIREAIFQHWGIDNAQNWQAAMVKFTESPEKSLTKIGVVPLEIAALKYSAQPWYWNIIED